MPVQRFHNNPPKKEVNQTVVIFYKLSTIKKIQRDDIAFKRHVSLTHKEA